MRVRDASAAQRSRGPPSYAVLCDTTSLSVYQGVPWRSARRGDGHMGTALALHAATAPQPSFMVELICEKALVPDLHHPRGAYRGSYRRFVGLFKCRDDHTARHRLPHREPHLVPCPHGDLRNRPLRTVELSPAYVAHR